MREAESRPIAHKITIEPKYSDYLFQHKDIKIIEDFNVVQSEKIAMAHKIVWSSILVLGILSIFEFTTILQLIWFSVPLAPFIFIFTDSIFSRFYKKHPLTENINKFNNDLREYGYYLKTTEINFWKNLSGHNFEKEVGKVLKSFFNQTKITKGSGDGGVDIILNENNIRNKIIIQCKNHKKKIGPEPVRALYGVMNNFKSYRAVIISTNGFTPGAIDFYNNNSNIYLYDVNDIMVWSKEKEINFAGQTHKRLI